MVYPQPSAVIDTRVYCIESTKTTIARATLDMASSSPWHARLQRRDSLPVPQSSRPRRPQTLRACTTEPSITISNAWRDTISETGSKRSATELLSQVWLIVNPLSERLVESPTTTGNEEIARAHESRQDTECSPNLACRIGGDGRHLHCPASPRGLKVSSLECPTAGYVSFPSFDAWEEKQTANGD